MHENKLNINNSFSNGGLLFEINIYTLADRYFYQCHLARGGNSPRVAIWHTCYKWFLNVLSKKKKKNA